MQNRRYKNAKCKVATNVSILANNLKNIHLFEQFYLSYV